MTQPEPVSVRNAHLPPDYGTPGSKEELLPWSFVDDRLRDALNYWLATVDPSGRPHVRPVDGVWLDGALCFGGSPDTRWVRNLEANDRISVQLGGFSEAIILEGNVERVIDPDHPLTQPSNEASRAKYPQYYTDGDLPSFEPFWAFRPRRVYAWTLDEFARRATRWTFEPTSNHS